MGVPLTGAREAGPGSHNQPWPPEAVFFQTHLLHPEVLQRFETLRDGLPVGYDLYLLLDVDGFSKGELRTARRLVGDALVAFTFDQVAAGVGDYPHPWAEAGPTGVVPGNNDLLWLHARRRVGGYDRYWFIEHDVAYSGDWLDFFEPLRARGADLLGTTIHPRSTLPEFHWWQSFSTSGGRFEGRDEGPLLRGFFPVVRVSDDALDALDHVYRAGWSGHAEVVVPTALLRLGLELEDIGGRGPFVPTDAPADFYTNTPTRPTLSPGTFVYKPSRRFPGLRRDKLWHPVKHTGGRISPYLEIAEEWLRAVGERIRT